MAGPTLFRLPEFNFVDDKAGKPVSAYLPSPDRSLRQLRR
jgi:hypothetical protein